MFCQILNESVSMRHHKEVHHLDFVPHMGGQMDGWMDGGISTSSTDPCMVMVFRHLGVGNCLPSANRLLLCMIRTTMARLSPVVFIVRLTEPMVTPPLINISVK